LAISRHAVPATRGNIAETGDGDKLDAPARGFRKSRLFSFGVTTSPKIKHIHAFIVP
jgi:hypothetical protein